MGPRGSERGEHGLGCWAPWLRGRPHTWNPQGTCCGTGTASPMPPLPRHSDSTEDQGAAWLKSITLSSQHQEAPLYHLPQESRLAETESCRQTHTWPRALAVLMGLWWPHDQKAGEEVLRLRERCPGLQATATGSGEHGAFPVHSQGVWVSTHWQGTAVCPLQTPPPDAFIRNNKVLS